MPYDVWKAQVGHVVTYDDTVMRVWAISPPGTGGRSMDDGPLVWAHIAKDGYGVTFDNTVHQYHRVEIAHPSQRSVLG